MKDIQTLEDLVRQTSEETTKLVTQELAQLVRDLAPSVSQLSGELTCALVATAIEAFGQKTSKK